MPLFEGAKPVAILAVIPGCLSLRYLALLSVDP